MTPTFKFKKNFLIILIALAIVLIAANIILKDHFTFSKEKETYIDEKGISQRFRNIFDDFGIEKEFIKENYSIDKETNREISRFKVQVPKDLTIPEILLEIYKSFRKDSLTINSIEKVKGGRSILTFKSGKKLILEAEFDNSKNYFRNMGSLVFILYDVNPTEPSTISLIESPSKFNFLIRPETKYLQSIEVISNNSQQFSILIDDEISEQKYQLGPGFSQQRTINVIKTLVNDFKKAVCFIIDDNSNFYKSNNYKLFSSELLKRNIKLYKTSDFLFLDYSESLDFVFAEELNGLSKGGTKIFLLSEESYSALKSEITKYEMKGFKVITSSLVL